MCLTEDSETVSRWQVLGGKHMRALRKRRTWCWWRSLYCYCCYGRGCWRSRHPLGRCWVNQRSHQSRGRERGRWQGIVWGGVIGGGDDVGDGVAWGGGEEDEGVDHGDAWRVVEWEELSLTEQFICGIENGGGFVGWDGDAELKSEKDDDKCEGDGGSVYDIPSLLPFFLPSLLCSADVWARTVMPKRRRQWQ